MGNNKENQIDIDMISITHRTQFTKKNKTTPGNSSELKNN